MSNRKILNRIILIFAFGFLASLLWYFFIKPYDYAVHFIVKTSPGIVYNQANNWNKWDDLITEPKTKVIFNKPFSELHQNVVLNNTDLVLFWTFKPINDSLTKVKVNILDNQNSLINRLKIPFMDTEIEKEMRLKLMKFRESVNYAASNNFKVRLQGEAVSPKQFVIYTSLKSSMENKAMNMMREDGMLFKFIDSTNLEKTGYPFIEVTYWDLENDSINYNFGYPIKEIDSLPSSEMYLYKNMTPEKSLKAIFNGNYRISNRAWYVLYDDAIRNQIDVENNKILEIFHNNPYNGGNELKWETEVFMTLKNE